MNKPKVSVIGASYNHERYIGEAIESILNQTFQDFELIIIDDASSDNSSKIIKKYDDSRIKFIQHEQNKGIPRTFNEAYSHAKGEYITFMPGDDVSLPEKLEKQVKHMEKNHDIGAVYTQMNIINENSNETMNTRLGNYYSQIKYLGRFESLEFMFFKFSCLPAPPMLIRREVLENCGFYDNSLPQTQDLAHHIQILLKYDVHLIEEVLMSYRILPDEQNISTPNNKTLMRTYLEKNHFLDSYLTIKNSELFLNIFGLKALKYGKPKSSTIPYFLARMAIDTDDYYMQIWGYSILSNFLSEKDNFDLIEKEYGFTNKDHLELINLFTNKDQIISNQAKELKKQQLLSKQVETKLKTVIESKDKEIKDLMNSNSWKVTKPLRKLNSWLN